MCAENAAHKAHPVQSLSKEIRRTWKGIFRARKGAGQTWKGIFHVENHDHTLRDLRRMVRPLRAQMRAVLRRHPEFVTPWGV